MSEYTARVTREGKWWMIAIPEIDGLTQARRLSDAREMAREYIAVTADRSIDDIEVTLSVESVDGVPVAEILATIHDERAQAEKLERDARERAEALAKSLASLDIPVREIGAVRGCAFHRAHQLLKNP